jgi:hypothetical protein
VGRVHFKSERWLGEEVCHARQGPAFLWIEGKTIQTLSLYDSNPRSISGDHPMTATHSKTDQMADPERSSKETRRSSWWEEIFFGSRGLWWLPLVLFGTILLTGRITKAFCSSSSFRGTLSILALIATAMTIAYWMSR